MSQKTITVTHPNGSYPIYLGPQTLDQTGDYLAALGYQGRCAVITNSTIGEVHAPPLLESLNRAGLHPTRIDIPDGEQYKTLNTVGKLYDELISARLDRRSPVISLGGGVVGDTAGFAAASFLRGVPFVQIPTTLLAMVDASVGGKTGVDLPQGKNLVGAFKQPELVIIDPQVLGTLPEAEFEAGMAEIIKHGIIGAPELFETLEKGQYDINEMLYEAVMVKVQVVTEDPFEQGRRAVLNLGHTFAHAFERLAGYEMGHGYAVAIGMACAAWLAVDLGHCQAATAERIVGTVARYHLPTTPPNFEPAAIWQAMGTDKKRQGNTIRFILPRSIGDVDIFDDVPPAAVKAVLKRLQA